MSLPIEHKFMTKAAEGQQTSQPMSGFHFKYLLGYTWIKLTNICASF